MEVFESKPHYELNTEEVQDARKEEYNRKIGQSVGRLMGNIEGSHNRSDISSFMKSHGRDLSVFAGDASLNYQTHNTPGVDTAYFDAKDVSINIPESWLYNPEYSQPQLKWIQYHELGHFIDMRKNPDVFLDNFDRMRKDAESLARDVHQRHPEVGKDQLEGYIYEGIHALYNRLDDIYVNNLVGIKSPNYRSGEYAKSVADLYIENLGYSKDDIREIPPHEQFSVALLQDEMVGDIIGRAQVSDEVEAALSKKKLGKDIREVVSSKLKPTPNRLVDPKERYELIRAVIQPEYIKLMMDFVEENLSEMDLQQLQQSGQSQESEDSQESQDGQQSQQGEQSQDGQDSEDSQQGEQSQDSEESQDSQQGEQSQDSQESQDGQQSQQGEQSQDSEGSQDSQESQDGQQSQQGEQSQDGQDSEDSQQGEQSQDSEESQDSQQGEQSQDSQESQDGQQSQDSQNDSKSSSRGAGTGDRQKNNSSKEPDFLDYYNKQNESDRIAIDEETVRQILEYFSEQQKVDSMSPKEREDYLAKKQQELFDEENQISVSQREAYEYVKARIIKPRKEMRKFWKDLIGKSIEYESIKVNQQRRGSLNVGDFINNYAQITESQKRGDNREMNIYSRNELEAIPVEKPEKIEISLVVDGSGSMDRDKIMAARKTAELLMLSIKDFNDYLNQTRRQTKSNLRADTEMFMFGSKFSQVKTFSDKKNINIEEADIIKSISKIDSEYGETNDHLPLRYISDNVNGDQLHKISEQKLKKIVFHITDGGSGDPIEARRAVDSLIDKGILAFAFQIGEVDSSERASFDYVWNSRPDGLKLGLHIGSDVSNLPIELSKKLTEALKGIRI